MLPLSDYHLRLVKRKINQQAARLCSQFKRRKVMNQLWSLLRRANGRKEADCVITLISLLVFYPFSAPRCWYVVVQLLSGSAVLSFYLILCVKTAAAVSSFSTCVFLCVCDQISAHEGSLVLSDSRENLMNYSCVPMTELVLQRYYISMRVYFTVETCED